MKNADDNILWQLQYLKDTLGVTEAEIEEAVSKVGTNQDYIKMYLLNKQNDNKGEIEVPDTSHPNKTDDDSLSDVFDNTLGSDTD